jgi:hypothetical protein
MTPLERQTLARLADIMIPGGLGMPPAAAAGVAGAGVDRVLAAEPRYTGPLRRFMAGATGIDSLDALDAASRKDAEGFRALSVVVANAYFMHTEVRAAIGYPGQEARDSSRGLGDEMEALAARVAARGPIWRGS